MALALGTGPFGERSSGAFNFDTSVLRAHTLYFEDSPKRVRAVFNGETVADSRSVKILHETGHLPVSGTTLTPYRRPRKSRTTCASTTRK